MSAMPDKSDLIVEVRHPELLALAKKAIAAAHQLHVHVRGCERCMDGESESPRCYKVRQHAQDALQALLVHVDEQYTPNDSSPLPRAGFTLCKPGHKPKKLDPDFNPA